MGVDGTAYRRGVLRPSHVELRGWSDYALEQHGRLTHPLRYDAQIDQYVPTTWDEAYAAIGAQLKQLAPDAVGLLCIGTRIA